MITQEDFLRAVAEPKFRQEFLEQIDLGDYVKYVKDVLYLESQDHDNNLMKTSSKINKYRIKKATKSKISVYPASFVIGNPYISIEDFNLSLIDHECFHAKEVYECPLKYFYGANLSFVKRIFTDLTESEICKKAALESELRAVQNQINNPSNRNLSSNYKENLSEIFYSLSNIAYAPSIKSQGEQK